MKLAKKILPCLLLLTVINGECEEIYKTFLGYCNRFPQVEQGVFQTITALSSIQGVDLDSDSIKSDCKKLDQSLKNSTYIGTDNEILADLKPLAHLNELEEIESHQDDVSDLSPLSKLKNLKILMLGGRNITGLTSLSNLTNLEEIRLLNKSKITDLSPLSALNKLELLFLSGPNIKLSSIPPLKNLEILEMPRSNINNLKPLSKLPQLSDLVLIENKIEDITDLKKIKNLSYLELSYNNISNFDILPKLKKLRFIIVEGNPYMKYFKKIKFAYSGNGRLLGEELNTLIKRIKIHLNKKIKTLN